MSNAHQDRDRDAAPSTATASEAKKNPNNFDEDAVRVTYNHLYATASKPLLLARRATVPYRKYQLRALATLMRENKTEILDALHSDLHKSPHEAEITEFAPVISEIATAVGCLDAWTRPTPTPRMLALTYASSHITPVPRGLVLIIGPWNYPLHLLLMPLVSAIAGGNAAILKPSEMAPHTSAVLARLIPRYLDPELYALVEGGVMETRALLELKFDYIFFTGSTRVGKLVLAAAAPHLTPVTLELGGKCPAIVHDPTDDGQPAIDLRVVARRIAWGKFMNAGQTCIAPDYVICPAHRHEELAHYLAEAISDFYGAEPRDSRDYGRIVNDTHYTRLTELMAAAEGSSHTDTATNTNNYNNKASSTLTPACGGLSQCDREKRYIPPTVYTQQSRASPLIDGGEIFGPILPILALDTTDVAAVAEQASPSPAGSPLAIYVFSNDSRYIQDVIDATRSGAVVVNDTVVHVVADGVPFGGVGESGMGRYHGKPGFDSFTHARPVIHRGLSFESLNSLRYAPYSDGKLSMMRRMIFYDL